MAQMFCGGMLQQYIFIFSFVFTFLKNCFDFSLFIDEVPVIVADIGHSNSRFGTGGEAAPKHILRTVCVSTLPLYLFLCIILA